MLPLAFAVLLETRFAILDAGLGMAAQASPRPRECRGAVSGDDGLWLRLRGADAARYCDLLARGHARLQQTPAEALSAAQAAEALAGSTPAVRVLTGRAQLRLAQPLLAYESFVQAEGAAAQAFADPKALHDYARAASLAQKPAQAVRLYRLLMSQSALLDDALERAFARIEAAAHVLAHVPNGADEALGYLSQARQQPLGLSAWVSALRLLALQRSGRAEPHAPGARPSIASLGAPPPAAFNAEFPLLPLGQFEALRALLSPPNELAPVKGKPR
jgi:hypothetical protein